MEEGLRKPQMEKLNLPAHDFRIEEAGNGKWYIFDPLRKKNLLLTPEEWVRQHLVQYMVGQLNYPKSLIALERGLTYNALQKRFDILVLNREGGAFFLMECKAPEVPLTQKTIEQVGVYNQKIKATFLGISNGRKHICLRMDNKSGSYRQINHFPVFSTD
ncbi:type I restriction enzyme HsdR N-terminal domain-containing protein [Cyclobacterium plantarum]|uniref:Type I restriction enzyme HsdR N-terminal domain-containing protein n=1 Tax=Cyclobacterium plantarum TaxID=2716263 RepID=A0ABX0H8E9_9BACT|nr:type I restriction enzyme HsdR N-terminal domain-containing protein [Cyclobacterium plantarum]NHE57655.1 type I restriction enzyme HsdR N-terminal domain-containing protein [Cyclobacterium plantarum]